MSSFLTQRLLTAAEMRAVEQETFDTGVSSFSMMEEAGHAVARFILVQIKSKSFLFSPKIGVLCGPGHNGGDGFITAFYLRKAGLSVEVACVGSWDTLKGDNAKAAEKWAGPIGTLEDLDLTSCAGLVDALFGIGLARDLEGSILACVTRVKAWHQVTPSSWIVAIDIPSGVETDTGRIRGGAIPATHTVTFFRPKLGHVLFPGCAEVGHLHVAPLSFVAHDPTPSTHAACLNHPRLWEKEWPHLTWETHKYKRGYVVILSGVFPYLGATRLAAHSAARMGAGLVTLACPQSVAPIQATHLTHIMVASFENDQAFLKLLQERRWNVLVLGPGLEGSEETRERLKMYLNALILAQEKNTRKKRHLVLDAGALTSFAGCASQLGQLIRAQTGACVVTPHEGEWATLFSDPEQAPSLSSKVERARYGARILGAILVLKGPDTIVAHPEGRVLILEKGSPWLATAGSGDVLAGFIAGLLAQGMEPFEAAAAAVWFHNEVAHDFGPGLVADDLYERLPVVLKRFLEKE